MSDDKKSPPRATPHKTVPPPTSAGFEASQERARALKGLPNLPFDPHDYVIKDALPAKLEQVDEIDLLHRLQRFDSRNSAAAHYERRIDAITEARTTSDAKEE